MDELPNERINLISDGQSDADGVDPDPFSIGFALMGLLFAGAAYLEARRQRMLTVQQRTNEFRSTWFQARRTLIHARRIVEEFSPYVLEDGYGGSEFLFGRVRLTLERGRVDRIRRLHANAQTTATFMADNLDSLSEFLDAEYQPYIEEIMAKLNEAQLPHTYDAVLLLAREGVALYEALINRVGEVEGFADNA